MVNPHFLACFFSARYLLQRYFDHEPFAAVDPDRIGMEVSQRQSFWQIRLELPGEGLEGEPRIWEVLLYAKSWKGERVSF